VRIAKTQFAALAVLGNQRVRLVFDSFLQPSEAAVRGSVSARQFLFETDELYVDLRLTPPRPSKVCSSTYNRDRYSSKPPIPITSGNSSSSSKQATTSIFQSSAMRNQPSSCLFTDYATNQA
jgi:hypothetical protein